MEIEIEYFDILRKNTLFKNMSAEEIKKTIHILKGNVKKYKKNSFVHRDYEPFFYFGLVLSGVVSACCDDIDGNLMILTEVTTSKTFGESLCFLKTENSPVYVLANENCKILWLSTDNLYNGSFDSFTLEIQKRFTQIIAERPLEMNRRIQVLSKTKLRDKITTYLSELSVEKGKKTITVPLNREDMAIYIGANRTALSRELSLMKKEGIIDYHKNTFYILN